MTEQELKKEFDDAMHIIRIISKTLDAHFTSKKSDKAQVQMELGPIVGMACDVIIAKYGLDANQFYDGLAYIAKEVNAKNGEADIHGILD